MGQAEMADVVELQRGSSRLYALLHRLSAAGGNESAADCEAAGGDVATSNMLKILREIDETVLPRYLTVFDGDTAVARLLVSNRRLMEVDVEGEADTAAVADPEAAARVFARRLRHVAGQCQQLDIRVTGRDLITGHSGISCSAAQLAAVAGLSAPGAARQDRMNRFLERVKPLVKAWVQTGTHSGEEAEGGDTDLAERLRNLSRDGYGQVRRGRVSPGRPDCAVLPLSGIESLVCASDGDARVLALVSGGAAADILAAWSEIYRSAG